MPLRPSRNSGIRSLTNAPLEVVTRRWIVLVKNIYNPPMQTTIVTGRIAHDISFTKNQYLSGLSVENTIWIVETLRRCYKIDNIFDQTI